MIAQTHIESISPYDTLKRYRGGKVKVAGGDLMPMPDITVHYFSKDSEGRASMPWKVRIWK